MQVHLEYKRKTLKDEPLIFHFYLKAFMSVTSIAPFEEFDGNYASVNILSYFYIQKQCMQCPSLLLTAETIKELNLLEPCPTGQLNGKYSDPKHPLKK